MAKLSFWYEFASTYSFLSVMRIEELAQKHDVDVTWRPFLLGPIFKAQGLNDSPFNIFPIKGRYMWRDFERRAEALGLGQVAMPEPFPQNGLMAARLALIGDELGWARGFTKATYQAAFVEQKNIGGVVVLSALLDGMGQDGAALIAKAKSDDAIKARLRENTEEAQAQGVFGAPSFLCEDGELFWGDDRLEEALLWARKVG